MSRFLLPFAMLLSIGLTASAALAEAYNAPWRHKNSSIVLDAYEYTLLDWSKINKNNRLVGFINKASDGLPPAWRCPGDTHCRLKWRRYTAAKELYHTRKTLAKTLGLKWGAYHLARPGNPIQQAEHFLRFTRPEKDDLLALDIEHNDPSRFLSLEDAEIFARYVKRRIGRYPVLYTNHATAKFIAQNRTKYRLLSRLNLWYARYKGDIRGVFPMGNWPSYTIWQFSSKSNCNKRRCLRRIAGADNFIDVNVVAMSPSQMRRKWPFAELTAKENPSAVKSKPAVVAKSSTDTSASAEAAVAAFLPSQIQKPALHALNSLMNSTYGENALVPDGRIAVPRWKPEAVVLQGSRGASFDEIGVPNPLVALVYGPQRALKTGARPTIDRSATVQAEHALDTLAEPREAMVRAERPFPMDGILKLFPAEAILGRSVLQRGKGSDLADTIF